MMEENPIKKAFFAAFPYTIPILAGFLFLGMAYGIYMNASGFCALYPIFMSITIFAGSMEFVAVGLLLGAFDPLRALALTLMVNARHLFYGLSMLDKYKGVGKKRFYLIYGMCDESFSINCTVNIPLGVDKGWFMFFVTLLNHLYWVTGSALGGMLGAFLPFDTQGIEFVMTALFLVIFLEQWKKDTAHHSALLGLSASFLCLLIFGGDRFMIPAMLLILASLTFLKRTLEKTKVRR
jgi:4-azaleucine resistance transporter AzlC